MYSNGKLIDHTSWLAMNPSAKPELSIISAGLVVVGKVISTGEIQLEGKISGDVRSPGLIIGHSGRVEGDVFAGHVEVLGEIVGTVSARSVFVTSTGRVNGDLLWKISLWSRVGILTADARVPTGAA